MDLSTCPREMRGLNLLLHLGRCEAATRPAPRLPLVRDAAADEGADATQAGLGQDPYPELGDFADGDAQIGPPEVGDFADGTHFSTADEPPPDDFGDGFGSSEEEFDAGSFGGGDGGGAEEGGPGLLGQIWDFFNDFNED